MPEFNTQNNIGKRGVGGGEGGVRGTLLTFACIFYSIYFRFVCRNLNAFC